MNKVLVIEDTTSLREVLCTVLKGEGFDVTGVSSAEEGISALQTDSYAAILTDLKLPRQSGLDVVRESHEHDRNVPVLVMTAYGSVEVAVEAMQLGAKDFISKPFDPDDLCGKLHSASHDAAQRRKLSRSVSNSSEVVSRSAAMQKLLRDAERLAKTDIPVLLLGESGVGKDLLARYIHSISLRSTESFIAVNCGSCPEETLESTFFGHEAGAFTGASNRRIGMLEAASGGTLFLDEIGNMPYPLQVTLLRALQESEITRLGTTKCTQINTRIISATNADLDCQISAGKFRADLFYRLGAVSLRIPPLRERIEDISCLALRSAEAVSKRIGEPEGRKITSAAISALEQHDWPGNIRELQNVIERAILLNDGPIATEHLNMVLSSEEQSVDLLTISSEAARTAEIEVIERVLKRTAGNKSKAAKLLGVSYKTLLSRIKSHEIS